MIPLNLIRDKTDIVKIGIAAKRENVNINQILMLDKEQRSILNELNDKRAKRNVASESIGKAKVRGENASDVIKEMKVLSNNIKNIESKLTEITLQLESLLFKIPNLPHKSVPIGAEPEDNVVIREWGEKPQTNFNYRNHLELGEKLYLFAAFTEP